MCHLDMYYGRKLLIQGEVQRSLLLKKNADNKSISAHEQNGMRLFYHEPGSYLLPELSQVT